jgi:predicted dienelactone hydrolase
MKHKLAGLAAIVLLFAFPECRAQEVQHIDIAGRDVAVWKPVGRAPSDGYPLIVFSHGFTGCNTQTKFLMQALAQAGYLVVAPNHKNAGCARGRHFSNGGQKPEMPFRDASKWSDGTYRDRRDDLEAVLDQALSGDRFLDVPVDHDRVGIAGHSLGGYTVLGLAGGWASWKDSRVKAVLALSPYCSPFLAKTRLGELGTPVMYQGGTRDFAITPMVKKADGAYDQPKKPKFYVELDGAGHFAWTDLNRTYVSSIDAYSVAFFDAYLRNQRDGLTKLMHGGRPENVSDLRSRE